MRVVPIANGVRLPEKEPDRRTGEDATGINLSGNREHSLLGGSLQINQLITLLCKATAQCAER